MWLDFVVAATYGLLQQTPKLLINPSLYSQQNMIMVLSDWEKLAVILITFRKCQCLRLTIWKCTVWVWTEVSSDLADDFLQFHGTVPIHHPLASSLFISFSSNILIFPPHFVLQQIQGRYINNQPFFQRRQKNSLPPLVELCTYFKFIVCRWRPPCLCGNLSDTDVERVAPDKALLNSPRLEGLYSD
jgi:hypothetical protein